MAIGLNKRRATGEPKAMRSFKMGDHEEKKTEERITLKVWNRLNSKSRL